HGVISQECGGLLATDELVTGSEPPVGRLMRILKSANLLRTIGNGEFLANKKPTQHGCMGSV
ncbi:hypothetical protein, partial [Aeromonas fluvialis]|uniref:hypothetical protein n=1 Tax=Aeromonas fluvialis TaxID=591962 RepID=UPI0005A77B53